MLHRALARPRPAARHRSAGPVRTPVTGLTAAVAARGEGARRAARRSVVVVAATGLVMTAGVSSSTAEPVAPVAQTVVAPAVETPAPLPAPEVTDALTVAADVPVTFARGESAAVTAPPPPPEPEPVVVAEPADEAEDEGASDETSSDEDASDESSSDEGSSDGSADEDATDERGEDSSVSRSSSREDSSDDEDEDEDSSEGASASSAGSSVLDIAAQYVGTPYVYGGTTPSGFDCSGFTSYVFAQAGISLPRTAAQQGAQGQRVSRSEARPGDLAVVSDGSHVGIYAGGNQWYDSPRPGKSVSLRDIWTSDVYFVRY